jgi:ATP-dependent exoDNAse (exonuclease V) alpha subunit
MYGGIDHLPLTPHPIDYFLDHAILAPRNVDVQDTNDKILAKMQGHKIIFHSADSLESDEQGVCNNVPEEFLRTIDPASLPLSELKVKLGCPLMLLQNLDPGKGLCNDTRMILLHAYAHLLEVMIISGDHQGEKAFIPRITLKPSSQQYPFILKRHQFPVHLSFAMTINKAQGQSLKYVGIHLLSPVFCHGQLYITLSRATSPKRVHILLPNTTHTKTSNIVYKEVLLD